MNSGRTVLSQVFDFVSQYQFVKFVNKYQGNYLVRSFTCWEQFIVMTFAQLTGRESLRDIEACLGAVSAKLYHSGLKSEVKKSTLANANEKRDRRFYFLFNFISISQWHSLSVFISIVSVFFNKNSANCSSLKSE
jgi:hypothetical protein